MNLKEITIDTLEDCVKTLEKQLLRSQRSNETLTARCGDAELEVAALRAQRVELTKKISKLEAGLWVAKDSQLRTYDGLATKAHQRDALVAALRDLVHMYDLEATDV